MFVVSSASRYDTLLLGYPSISRPVYTEVRHNTTLHIKTMGPPAGARPQRLTHDRLHVAKAEFDHMLDFGRYTAVLQQLVLATPHGPQKDAL